MAWSGCGLWFAELHFHAGLWIERLRKIKKNVIVHQVAYCGGMTYNPVFDSL